MPIIAPASGNHIAGGSLRLEERRLRRTMVKIDKTLDVRGLAGPRTSALTMQTLEAMHDGQVLRVIADDRKARHAIPLMCETCGHRILELTQEAGTVTFTIQK